MTSLQSYFATLAAELSIELEITLIRVDNARTVRGSFDASVFGTLSPDESSSRWMETSSSSDVSLSVPHRSIDGSLRNRQLDRARLEPPYHGPILYCTERWLQELPMDGPHHDELPTNSTRVRSFDDEVRAEESDNEDDIPVLQGCRYVTDEKHPLANLAQLSRGGSKICEDESANSLDCTSSEDSREDKSTFIQQEDGATQCSNEMRCLSKNNAKSQKKVGTKCKKEKYVAFEVAASTWLDRKQSFE